MKYIFKIFIKIWDRFLSDFAELKIIIEKDRIGTGLYIPSNYMKLFIYQIKFVPDFAKTEKYNNFVNCYCLLRLNVFEWYGKNKPMQ